MGLVFGAFALGYAIAQVPSGWFADRFGPRIALTAVVAGWSLLTALTGAVHSLASLFAVRFAFGIAEAGAFPGSARVFYNWLPPEQHGRANGITFSGSRLGAAFAFPLLAWLMDDFGWRRAFYLLCLPGLLWAVLWSAWFHDRPQDYTPERSGGDKADVPLRRVFASKPMLLAMAQYFASNFTFFLCFSWMNPYLIERYGLATDTAAWCSTLVFLFGATAQWLAGFLTDALHRSRLQEHSRRIPAATLFLLSAVGVAALPNAGTAATAVALFTVAAFGAEMTISPSWSFCIDLGGPEVRRRLRLHECRLRLHEYGRQPRLVRQRQRISVVVPLDGQRPRVFRGGGRAEPGCRTNLDANARSTPFSGRPIGHGWIVDGTAGLAADVPVLCLSSMRRRHRSIISLANT